MKDIKFEVSDEIYWQFVAQVDNGVSIPGGVRRRVWFKSRIRSGIKFVMKSGINSGFSHERVII